MTVWLIIPLSECNFLILFAGGTQIGMLFGIGICFSEMDKIDSPFVAAITFLFCLNLLYRNGPIISHMLLCVASLCPCIKVKHSIVSIIYSAAINISFVRYSEMIPPEKRCRKLICQKNFFGMAIVLISRNSYLYVILHHLRKSHCSH